MEAAKAAQNVMGEQKPETLPDILREQSGGEEILPDVENSAPVPETPIPRTAEQPSVVYLTSDSPYTLERLEPYTSYVIGGLVDRNREKGICYKRAMAHGVKTAKLPIGEYMTMASRFVLTTNQVVEIMSKWLECADWGTAFAAIVPPRKGGKLKESTNGAKAGDGDGDESIHEQKDLESAQGLEVDQEEADDGAK